MFTTHARVLYSLCGLADLEYLEGKTDFINVTVEGAVDPAPKSVNPKALYPMAALPKVAFPRGVLALI